MTIAGFTSTASKRPDLLFGDGGIRVPQQMVQARGCRVTGVDGREFVDFIMALGAVALGYGHPTVNEAVIEAVHRGTVGPLAPESEARLAADLQEIMPGLERVRLLKSGAEAVAAAVRLARVVTGRERVIGCGYHGWLDWCSDAAGVPAAVRALYRPVRFNDIQHAIDEIRAAGDRLACIVIEPVIECEPRAEWLAILRSEATRTGAILVFDEVKTAFRVALGGATERWGVRPDLVVLGKALANGFPLAAVGGSAELMDRVRDTWISSTLATEFVSIAAARATVAVMRDERVPDRLRRSGERLFAGLRRIERRHGALGIEVKGIPEMCFLQYRDDGTSRRVAAACAERGLLFKRTAYNFVALPHDDACIDDALATLDEVLAAC